ncbi:hypothetical protein PFISCL1PPCAC_2443, partial [Pristionchus fissidentatus]
MITVASKSRMIIRSDKRKQVLYSIQQFIPIVALHAIVHSSNFCWYLFTSVAANVSISCTSHIVMTQHLQVVPHYCLLCPLIFLVLIRRGRFKRVSHVQTMVNPERKPNEVSNIFK